MSETPPAPPPPSDLSLIDPDALRRWLELPEGATIILQVARADLDALFLGLRNGLFAQGGALASFQSFTHGDLEKANEHFAQAVQNHRDATANIARFISAMMAKAASYE